MKRVKLTAAVMLALGLIAIAVGGSFYISGTTAVRPVKTFQDFMEDANRYLDNGDYYKAVVSYENALLERSDDQEALSGLASVYGRQANYEKENAVRNQIAQLFPDDLDNQIRLIEIMIHNKEFDAAKQKTEELMKKQDSDALKSLYGDMNVDAPVFNLSSGSYEDYQVLQLTNTYNNAVVHYTTDGSEPTSASNVYKNGIVISYPETVIRAKAISLLGYESSEVQLNFTITKAVEAIPLRANESLYQIASRLFNKNWNGTIYNYELAQVREIYILGEYSVDSEPHNATFYNGYYKMYENRYTDLGDFSLDFAKYMPFLQTLSVNYQKGLDLTPLASLRYIQNLSLLNDGITDVSPLTGLTSLERLALGWNNISDISPLAGLTGLESLGLWNNQINDVSMLDGLSNLTYFDIANNQVAKIDSVSRMLNLNEAWVNNNQIQDLSPLGDCEKLMVLMQGNNPISDYSSIKHIAARLYKSDLE